MSQPRPPSRQAVEQALAELLESYAGHQALSAWDRHCLDGALTMLRFGYYKQALRRIGEVMQPPFPLPRFAAPPPLTVEEVRHAVRSTRAGRMAMSMSGAAGD